MRKAYIVFAAVIFTLIFCTCAYSETSEDTQGTEFPEIHAIAYDPALDTLEDEDGADYYNHSLDHPDSRYYIIMTTTI